MALRNQAPFVFIKFIHDYSSHEWLKIKEMAFERDNGKCVLCQMCLVLHSGKHDRLLNRANIHHVISRSLGGKDELKNVITLCTKCHYKIHKEANSR